jgi:hypothetical protein
MSQQINLFNPIFLEKKKHFSARAMLQSLALVLGGLLLLQVFALYQSRSVERLLADASRDAAQRRDQLVTLTKQFSSQGASKTLEQDLPRAEAQLRKRAELLAELRTSAGGNAHGFSAYLAALARRGVQGVWLTGVEVNGRSNDLVIKGRALSAELVPAYVRELSRDPVFAGRALNALQVIAREEAAPPAPGATSGARPLRYLEFTLSIPLASLDGARGAS